MKQWRLEDDIYIWEHRDDSTDQLAAHFGRSIRGITQRLKHLCNPDHKAYQRLHATGSQPVESRVLSVDDPIEDSFGPGKGVRGSPLPSKRQICTLDSFLGSAPPKVKARAGLPPKCSEDEMQSFMAAYKGSQVGRMTPGNTLTPTALRELLCEVLRVPGITMRRLWDIAGAFRTTKNSMYDVYNLTQSPYIFAKEFPPLITFSSCIALEKKYGFIVKPADVAGALVVDRLYGLVSGGNSPFVSVHKFEAALRECGKEYASSMREAVKAEIVTLRFGSKTVCTTRAIWQKIRFIEDGIALLAAENDGEEGDEPMDWDTTFGEHCGGLTFNTQQREACNGIFENVGLAITGGAGTGKTTVIAAMNSALMAQGTMVYNLAFSGKAVKVLRDRLPARAHCYTLHRFLRVIIHENDELDFDGAVIICDEASMVDIALFDELLRHVDATQSRIVFVGDPRQLPPVGLGAPFNDLVAGIKAGRSTFPHVELTTTNRYAEDMASFVAGIDGGVWNPPPSVKCFELPVLPSDREPKHHWSGAVGEVRSVLEDLLSEHPELRDLTKTMYLSAQHEYICGTCKTSALLQELLNPDGMGLADCSPRYGRAKGMVYKEGDALVRVINSYGSGDNEDHYNGDDGILKRSSKANKYCVEYLDGTTEDLRASHVRDEFELGYVRTIHKSQGGEVDNIVIFGPVGCHGMWRRAGGRRLLTVAVSRAKKAVYILGHASSITDCLRAPDEVHVGRLFSS